MEVRPDVLPILVKETGKFSKFRKEAYTFKLPVMKQISFFAAMILISLPVMSQVPGKEVQINTALLAAPADKRDGAMVYGYNANNEMIVLRKGTNEIVCIADDPRVKGLSVSCYHKDLEPFMTRGRELKAQGKSFQEIFNIREAEAKSGKLVMPRQAANLQVYSAAAENYDPVTGAVSKGNFRYVVYIPWATAASTGLPIKPEAPGMPWIMDPGTHRAHIMIDPPVKNQ